jgi:hypothetical protein
MRQRLITALTIGLLLLATGRLILLTRGELLRIRDAQRRDASIPTHGSLHGIGTRGVLAPVPLRARYRLLFVTHSATIAKDVEYWNATRQAIAPLESQIEWWGICDAGSSCNAFQGAARFSIVGFLDPFQMRLMALADVDGLALLYKGSSLRGRVTRAGQASVTAEAISNLLR